MYLFIIYMNKNPFGGQTMYYEDYEVGMTFDVPSISFSEEEIIAFAEQYDPRFFHLDVEESKKTRFNGLIASGFQTMIGTWSQWVKTGIDSEGLICGMSIDKNIWFKPVYADDLLTSKITVISKSAREGAKTGTVSKRLEVKNQDNNLVLEFEATVLVKCKEA